MGRKRLPDSQVSKETLKKRLHRENQRVKKIQKEKFWKDMGGPPPENAAELGRNIFDGAPNRMLDQEDGSLDRDKIRELSNAGNKAQQDEIEIELAQLRQEYGKRIEERGLAGKIKRKKDRSDGPENVPCKRTYQSRIKSLKNLAKPKGDIP